MTPAGDGVAEAELGGRALVDRVPEGPGAVEVDALVAGEGGDVDAVVALVHVAQVLAVEEGLGGGVGPVAPIGLGHVGGGCRRPGRWGRRGERPPFCVRHRTRMSWRPDTLAGQGDLVVAHGDRVGARFWM